MAICQGGCRISFPRQNQNEVKIFSLSLSLSACLSVCLSLMSPCPYPPPLPRLFLFLTGQVLPYTSSPLPPLSLEEGERVHAHPVHLPLVSSSPLPPPPTHPVFFIHVIPVIAWCVAGSILDKLGLPVSAETWLRHATRHAPSGDNSAAILFQKTRAKRLYAPLTQDMPVEVTFTSQGRSVHTTRGIKKGEVIFADKPMVLAQNLNTLKFLCCSNCVTSLIRPEDVFPPEELQKKKSLLGKAVKKYWPVRERFPCTCGHETYCSARCQQEAWENHHRVICKEKNPAVAKLYQVRVLSVPT